MSEEEKEFWKQAFLAASCAAIKMYGINKCAVECAVEFATIYADMALVEFHKKFDSPHPYR